MNGQSTEDFQGRENTLYDIIMMEMYCYTFVQIHWMHNTESEALGELWTLGDDNVSM